MNRNPMTAMARALAKAVSVAALLGATFAASAQQRVPQLQVDAFWPKPLPNNWLLGQVSGVAVDSRDHVWIVQRPASLSERELGAAQNPPLGNCCVAAPPVLVFDPSGNLVRAWGGPGEGYEWPASEHGIFVDADRLRVARRQRRQRLADPQVHARRQVPAADRPQRAIARQQRHGEPRQPGGSSAVDVAAREVYVADGYRNRRVIVFDSETGAYKRHWGAYGKRPSDDADAGVRSRGAAVAPVRQPRALRAADARRPRLRLRPRQQPRAGLPQGRHVRLRGVLRDATRALSGSVSELAFSPDAEQRFIYMVDGVNNELRIVERATNAVLGRVGRPGRYAGQFHVVHNVAVDSQGNVYTTEVNTGQRVQKFRRLDPQD